jgi:hypothetical protein
MMLRARLRIGLDVVILLLFVYGAIEALSFSARAQYMPLYVSVAGAVLCALLLVLDYRRILRGAGPMSRNVEDYDDPEETQEDDETRIGLAAYYLAWMTGYIVLVALVGLPLGSAVFVASFLLIDARMSLLGTAIGVAALIGCMVAISHFMHLRWPPSLIGW